jgi:hypothetical protein
MHPSRQRNRVKLLISFNVLVVVFVVAGVAEFGISGWPNSYISEAAATAPPEIQTERAVFGEPLPIPEVKDVKEEGVEEASSARSRTEANKPEALKTQAPGVDELLDRWRDTILSRNVDAQVSLYAPKVEHFFNRRNVSRELVRREKGRMLELYPEIRKYEISDVRLESAEDNQAVVSFRKEWDMRGIRRFTGAERQRLKLRKIAGVWKIVGEEETQVYWVKRG